MRGDWTVALPLLSFSSSQLYQLGILTNLKTTFIQSNWSKTGLESDRLGQIISASNSEAEAEGSSSQMRSLPVESMSAIIAIKSFGFDDSF